MDFLDPKFHLGPESGYTQTSSGMMVIPILRESDKAIARYDYLAGRGYGIYYSDRRFDVGWRTFGIEVNTAIVGNTSAEIPAQI
jgi:hypothetical protein